MSERALQFRTQREVEASRPRLDRSCTLPLSEFGGLVGPYTFVEADWVLCQLEHKGSVCRQPHGHGWVAKRKDGAEVYIGSKCAHDHFGADTKFAAEASRVRRELRVDDLIARASVKLNDAAFRQRVASVAERQHQLREQVTQARDAWPQSLLGRLREMVKTGNRAVMIELRYAEYDREKKREVVSWQPFALGSIASIEAVDATHLRQIGERVRAAISALDEAKPSGEVSEKALRAWVESLEGVDQCAAELDEISLALESFHRPENLKLLCWTVRSYNEQIEIVKAVLGVLPHDGRPTDEAARLTRNSWHTEIRASNAGRDFRVA